MATVQGLLDLLGGAALDVADAGRGLEVEVTEVVVADLGDVEEVPMGGLVLAVGLREPAELDALLPRLAGRGAAAVVVRPELARTVSRRSPALLVAAPGMPWQQLHRLLSGALRSASGGAAADESGDLFALANAVAAAVGGAVAVEDPRQRVLAYSNLAGQPIDDARREGILNRQVPDLPTNPDLYRLVTRSRGVVRIPGQGSRYGRVAIAVRAGQEVLGSIWAVDAGDIHPEADRLLEEAARTAALHLLRRRAAADAQRAARADVLLALLDGRSGPEQAAPRLDMPVNDPCTVVVVELPESPETPLEMLTERTADLLAFQAQAAGRRVVVAVTGPLVYALLSGDPAGLTELLGAVADRAARGMQVAVRAAVGSAATGLRVAIESRIDADRVLSALQERPAPAVAALHDVREQVVLDELRHRLLGEESLVLPVVRELLAHDRTEGTRYVETVLAYLRCFGDVPAAAEAVTVHPNTFRYRLRRLREVFDLDLDRADTRLVVWLQLRLLTGERSAATTQG